MIAKILAWILLLLFGSSILGMLASGIATAMGTGLAILVVLQSILIIRGEDDES